MNTQTKIWLEKPSGKRGIYILEEHYFLLSDFILSLVSVKRSITLCELLELARNSASLIVPCDGAWLILEVKQDLEARGLIRTGNDRNRVQYIILEGAGLSTMEEFIAVSNGVVQVAGRRQHVAGGG